MEKHLERLIQYQEYTQDDVYDKYTENDEFEVQADDILDFSESKSIWYILMLGTYYYHEIVRKTIISLEHYSMIFTFVIKITVVMILVI